MSRSYTRDVCRPTPLRNWTLGNRHPKRHHCKRKNQNNTDATFKQQNERRLLLSKADASSNRNWADSENSERRCILTFAAHAEFSTASTKATLPLFPTSTCTYTHTHTHFAARRTNERSIYMWLMCSAYICFRYVANVCAVSSAFARSYSPPPLPPLGFDSLCFFFSLQMSRTRFLRHEK